MSWWEERLGDAGEMMTSPLFGAFCASFCTALARILKDIKKTRYNGMVASTGEALCCAFLSLMLVQAGTLWFGLAPNHSIMVGVFTGYIGTEQISKYLGIGVRAFVSRWTKKETQEK